MQPDFPVITDIVDRVCNGTVEVLALRATTFRVGPAEALLGLSSKSRSLSHHFRGLKSKALSLHDLDVAGASSLLTGGDPSLGAVAARLLRELLGSLTERLGELDDRLLANVLLEHRRHGIEVLALLRRNRRASGDQVQE